MIFNKSNSNIKLFDLEPELEELSNSRAELMSGGESCVTGTAYYPGSRVCDPKTGLCSIDEGGFYPIEACSVDPSTLPSRLIFPFKS
jgi:hypothetical protein